MIYVSPEYMEAITAPSREMDINISFDFLDVSAKSDIERIEANTNDDRRNLPWFSVDNIYDCLPYGTCEQDQFETKGFYLIPFHDVFNWSVWGWSSAELSNENGLFSENPKITYYFSQPHSSLGISLYLDNPAKEIVVTWYDGAGNELAKEITGSANKIVVIERGVVDYSALSIEFVRMNPYQRVKLLEVDFGLHLEYGKNDVISTEVLEEIDISTNTLSYNTAEIVLYDKDQRFNLLNPNNQSKYLQEKQKIKISSGLMVNGIMQNIPMGEFYLSEWNSPDLYSVMLTGYDLISLLDGIWYESEFYNNTPAGDILERLFSSLGFVESGSENQGKPQYYIHPNVRDIKLTGYIEPMSYRDALQRIAFSCCAIAKVDRNGILNVYRSTEETQYKAIIDKNTIYQQTPVCGGLFCGQYPVLKQNIEPIPNPVFIDASISQTPDAQFSDYYNQIIVEYYDWNLNTDRENLFDGTAEGNMFVKYSKFPATNIERSGNLAGGIDYACTSYLREAAGNVSITGNVYEAQVRTYTLVIGERPGKTLKVEGITLIGNEETAKNIAIWLKGNLDKRVTHKFKWWANPAVEISDCVKLEDQLGNSSRTQITKNSFSYTGGWLAESEAIGFVD